MTLRLLPLTARQPNPDPVLHVMEGPIKAGPYWWARCSCGWQADPQETQQSAASLHCGVEEEELRSHRNEFRLQRHQHADREFQRRYPERVPQA